MKNVEECDIINQNMDARVGGGKGMEKSMLNQGFVYTDDNCIAIDAFQSVRYWGQIILCEMVTRM